MAGEEPEFGEYDALLGGYLGRASRAEVVIALRAYQGQAVRVEIMSDAGESTMLAYGTLLEDDGDFDFTLGGRVEAAPDGSRRVVGTTGRFTLPWSDAERYISGFAVRIYGDLFLTIVLGDDVFRPDSDYPSPAAPHVDEG